jgi:hypothetical protein
MKCCSWVHKKEKEYEHRNNFRKPEEREHDAQSGFVPEKIYG